MSVFNIMRFSFGNSVASIVIGIFLGLANLYFVSLGLAFLGRAVGTRIMVGIKWVSFLSLFLSPSLSLGVGDAS